MKYTIGDQVVIKNHERGWCSLACAQFYSDMERYIGRTATIVGYDATSYDINIDNDEFNWSECMFEEVSQMKYKEGDILVDGAGNEQMVLGVCGKVYLMSRENNFEQHLDGYMEKELDNEGYKLKSEEDTAVKEAIKLLKEKGKIKDGKILEE